MLEFTVSKKEYLRFAGNIIGFVGKIFDANCVVLECQPGAYFLLYILRISCWHVQSSCNPHPRAYQTESLDGGSPPMLRLGCQNASCELEGF